MARAPKNRMRKRGGISYSAICQFFVVCNLALVLASVCSTAALGSQTREQCHACCQNAESDDYYREQCRLKCFRNPDHCTGKNVQQASPEPQSTEPEQKTEPQPSRRSSDEIRLVWPNPLNLVAGKEQEAAARILAVNGVSQQHPYYGSALADLQAILVDFARRHPQGGKLPTTQLKGILRQLK